MNKFEKAFYNLMSNKSLYANIMLNCNLEFTKKVPTAAVALNKKTLKISFLFNPEFFMPMAVEKVEGLMEHEVLHLLFWHLNIDNRRKNQIDAHIWNIAEDIALNQWIEPSKLPDECLMPETLEKMLGPGVVVERKQTAEYYFNLMRENKDKMNFKIMATLDQHGFEDGDSDFFSPDEMKAITKDLLDRAMKQSAGKIPHGMESLIQEILSSKVPWQRQFRNFVGKAVSNKTKHTRSRSNRRFGVEQPGRKKLRTLKIAVCADVSGSMSDERVAQIIAETNSMTRSVKTEIIFIQADAEVQHWETVKPGRKVKFQRKGCGGTAYQPAIDKAVQLGVDAIVYGGDMDASDVPTNPNLPFVWLVFGSQKPPGDFGSVIRIED